MTINLEELETVSLPTPEKLDAMKAEIERVEASFKARIFFDYQLGLGEISVAPPIIYWNRKRARIFYKTDFVDRPLIEHKVLERMKGFESLQALVDAITRELKRKIND